MEVISWLLRPTDKQFPGGKTAASPWKGDPVISVSCGIFILGAQILWSDSHWLFEAILKFLEGIEHSYTDICQSPFLLLSRLITALPSKNKEKMGTLIFPWEHLFLPGTGAWGRAG